MSKLKDSYYELAPRARLRPNPDNPKLITEEDVDRMVTLLQVHGFKDPVEARHEDGLVLAGHRRLLASDRLGLTQIPTIFHVGMTDHEATAYTIAHTQAEAHVDWNRSLLADQLSGLPEELSPDRLGFSEKDVARLYDLDRGAADEGGDGDAGAEAQAGLRPGEQWTIGPVTFNVFKGLDNQGLLNAEMLIRKIARMLRCKAVLDGDETKPLDAVLKERAL
jgi:ParB-like chromosome segregation protein Spo0J